MRVYKITHLYIVSVFHYAARCRSIDPCVRMSARLPGFAVTIEASTLNNKIFLQRFGLRLYSISDCQYLHE